MRLIKHAVQIGVIVVIKTQCYHGTVDDLYEAGRQLTKIGCILATDMTIECLFAKLGYLLGKVSQNLAMSYLVLSHKFVTRLFEHSI